MDIDVVTPDKNTDIEQPITGIVKDDEGEKATGGNETESEDDEEQEKKRSAKDHVIKAVSSVEFLLLLSLLAIAIDPLFFYVPMIKIKSSTCLGLDKTPMIVVVILRTSVDILHDWSWWPKHTSLFYYYFYMLKGAYRRKRSRITYVVRILSELIEDSLTSRFLRRQGIAVGMAIIASLPLPQVMVLALHLQSDLSKWLKVGVICQFVPRIFRIYGTYADITSDSDMNAWAGGGFNLLLYVLASHIFGGFWYLRAVDRKLNCMKEACQGHLDCTKSSLYCESDDYADNGFINDVCSTQQTSNATAPHAYGLYTDAIKSNLIGFTSFINKLAHGFWWGLRNLSSMATNLDFNDRTGDTCFAILICILGLILFALLIGNLQVYLQSRMPYKLVKVKGKWEKKRNALEKWVPFSSLPPSLQSKVLECKYPRWLEASEVNIESLLTDLPWDLQRKLRRHFCKKLFKEVEEFEGLDSRDKKFLRHWAVPVVYRAGFTIHREGKPIKEMIYIVEGTVSVNDSDVENGSAQRILERGDSFGIELLERALEIKGQNGSGKWESKLPRAKQTVKSETQVEAFTLSFDDLEYFIDS